nr:hypothetical protein [Ruminococcus sp.]
TVRDVHKLQKPPESEEFQGRKHFIAYGQAPDFVILDKKFDQSKDNQKKYVYGCVEVKQFKKNDDFNTVKKILYSLQKPETNIKIYSHSKNVYMNNKLVNKLQGELLKEIVCFRRVIFTNGKTWYFIKASKSIKCITNIRLVVGANHSVSFKDEDIEITKLYDYSEKTTEKQGIINFEKFKVELEEKLKILNDN